MTSPRWLAALVVGFSALMSGCATLPDIASGVCGNGVVEPPEDCDTFAPNVASSATGAVPTSSVCRPKGTAGECHLDCRRRDDGSRPACPAGWGCDHEDICRAPTGQFDSPSPPVVAGAWSLLAGDFDGDGRTDVLSREPLDALGRSKLRFHYFDVNGVLADTVSFPKLVLPVLVSDLGNDGRSDLVFSDGRLDTMFGRADRTWVPDTFGSYRGAGTGVRIIGIADDPVQDVSPFVALLTIGTSPGYYIPDFQNRGVLRLMGPLDAPVETLVGDPASGNVIEDAATSPCREVVVAFRGATKFSFADSCTRDPATGAIAWRESALEWSVALDPPAAIDAGPQLVDINGDGHLDVLLGADGRPYVALGDGATLSTATPFRLHSANSSDIPLDIPTPLAAGDFTGDGAPDFVFPDHLLVSSPTASGLPFYQATLGNLAARWTDAKIVDLNGNGKLDVVAASSNGLGIDFFNGNGTDHLTPFSVSTNGAVAHLSVGDFDGDLVNDLAFIETGLGGGELDAVRIAFGTAAGPPLSPVAVARVHHADQLNVFRQDGLDNLALVFSETTPTGVTSDLSFLYGSGDRLPFAPFELTSFASDGAVQSYAALSLALGGLTAPHHGDLLVLASEPPLANPLQFWLLPAFGASNAPPVRMSDLLDARFEPVRGTGLAVHIGLASAVADLDGDGRDEAIFAMAADDAQHCGLVLAGTTSDGAAQLARHDAVVLSDSCVGPQLLPVDADGDGFIDIALLTGEPGRADRKLLVLWNDRKGGFKSSDVTVVSNGGDAPQAFTVLGTTPSRLFGFAYVTEHAAMLVSSTGSARVFGVPRTLAPLEHGSGIVAADVNGDNVTDLVLAASGSLSVLKAQLVTP